MSEPIPGMAVTRGVTLVRHLGAGAMGSVWLADHAVLKTRVVVKFMARELLLDNTSIARFSREAATASQVKSPHVVQMLDHGTTPDGQPYIIMEHLEGKDLGTYLLIVGRATPKVALSIVTQTARALGRAHEAGVVHRDIKPDNLFLSDTGDGEMFVKVLDFGVAKAPKLPGAKITTTGNLVGTPCYMSPEQINGARDLDHRADLWALAVVAYEMLTGTVPYQSDTAAGFVMAIGKMDVPPITSLAPSLPRAVDEWFRKACHRDPNERFASARELSSALGVALAASAPAPEAFDITIPDDRLPSFRDTAPLTEPMAATMPLAATVPTSVPQEAPRKKSMRAPALLGLLLSGVCVLLAVIAWRAMRVTAAAAASAIAPSGVASSASAEVAVVDAAAPAPIAAEVSPASEPAASNKITKPAAAPARSHRAKGSAAPAASGYDDIQ